MEQIKIPTTRVKEVFDEFVPKVGDVIRKLDLNLTGSADDNMALRFGALNLVALLYSGIDKQVAMRAFSQVWDEHRDLRSQ